MFPCQPHAVDGVVDPGVSVEEDAVRRHLDFVEDDERVLLVEAGREGLVERVVVDAVVVPADDLHPRGRHRDREDEGDVAGVPGDGAARVEGDLVREWAEGAEEPRAAGR